MGHHFKFIDDIIALFWTGKYIYYLFVSLSLGIVCLFSLLLSQPWIKNEKHIPLEKGIDIVFALDLSNSMLAQDITPTRLHKAKEVLGKYVNQSKNDRIWLVIFAWKPFLSVPLTRDYNFLKQTFRELQVDKINQNFFAGTAIWDALLYASSVFDESERQKIIVLLTDGEANSWIEILDAVRFLKQKNIQVYGVGIGWENPLYIEFSISGQPYRELIWGVDEKTLQSVAKITNGKYYRASDNASFDALFSELNLLEPQENELKTFQTVDEASQEIAWILLFVFTLLWVVQWWYFIK